MTLLQLFTSFFKVGAFSIGGGYAAIPLIQNQIVNINKWLSIEEFSNLVTIAEMTPGPIAVNSATFVGMKIAGLIGGIIATLGCITPSLIIVIILAKFYYKYKNLRFINNIFSSVRPAIVGLIFSAGLTLLLQAIFNGTAFEYININIKNLLLFIVASIILAKTKISPIVTMFMCGILSVLINYLI